MTLSLGRVQRKAGSSVNRLLSSRRTSSLRASVKDAGRSTSELSLKIVINKANLHHIFCFNNLRSNHINFGNFSKIKDGSFLILIPDRSRNSTFSPNFLIVVVNSSILGSFKNLAKMLTLQIYRDTNIIFAVFTYNKVN